MGQSRLKLVWSHGARQDLHAMVDYIEQFSVRAAQDTFRRIAAKAEQACAFPLSGRIVPELQDPLIRELIEEPYRLVYRPGESEVTVLAVFHARLPIPPDLASI